MSSIDADPVPGYAGGGTILTRAAAFDDFVNLEFEHATVFTHHSKVKML